MGRRSSPGPEGLGPAERALLVEGARAFGLALSADQVAQFDRYLRALLDWNRRVNLTAITEPRAVVIRHFLDSLSCLLAFPAGEGLAVIDVGTGAGFPGLPLKIARPDLRLTLLEATAKKVRFLEHVVQALGMSSVVVIWGRAETLAHDPAHRERYDCVVARALAELAALAELCLPFARLGGRVIAPKKGAVAAEIARARTAISLLGGRLWEPVPVTLPEEPERRFLVVIEKVQPTPPRFPRRPGMPVRRPLGVPRGRPMEGEAWSASA